MRPVAGQVKRDAARPHPGCGLCPRRSRSASARGRHFFRGTRRIGVQYGARPRPARRAGGIRRERVHRCPWRTARRGAACGRGRSQPCRALRRPDAARRRRRGNGGQGSALFLLSPRHRLRRARAAAGRAGRRRRSTSTSVPLRPSSAAAPRPRWPRSARRKGCCRRASIRTSGRCCCRRARRPSAASRPASRARRSSRRARKMWPGSIPVAIRQRPPPAGRRSGRASSFSPAARREPPPSTATRASCRAPAVDVVDTVGAGDTFMAGLLAILHADGALGAATLAPTPDQVAYWLAFATAAAALCCTRAGADPPTRGEVEGALGRAPTPTS